MKVKELLKKIGLGEDEFPPTVYWDFINTNFDDYDIIDSENIVFNLLIIDQDNKKLIFKK